MQGSSGTSKHSTQRNVTSKIARFAVCSCLIVCVLSCNLSASVGVLLQTCPGSGRRVGENCEQLWAQLRPLTKLTRYMSKDNYLFVLDDALLLVADDKMGAFVAFMHGQAQAINKKLGERRCNAACCMLPS